MPKKIFVNLPVRDLNRSMDFFRTLGFTFNAQFTDETAACMVISEDIYVMLLTENKFKTFLQNQLRMRPEHGAVLVGDELNE
jgi:predicted lactoylglutathione lyase